MRGTTRSRGRRELVGGPHAHDLDGLGAPGETQGGGDVGRRDQTPCDEDAGAGAATGPAQLVGEAGQVGEVDLDPRLGDERAAGAARGRGPGRRRLELGERLAQGHPADAETLGEVALAREPVAGGELAAADAGAQPRGDLHVDGRR